MRTARALTRSAVSCPQCRHYATAKGNQHSSWRANLRGLGYPLLLLSAFTSLAINLAYTRSAALEDKQHHDAQLSVLKALVKRLEARQRSTALTQDEQREIDRELELVGLLKRDEHAEEAEITWRDVLFSRGKRRKATQQDDDDEAHWEQALQEAIDKDSKETAPAPAAPPPLAATTTTTTNTSKQKPVYL